MVDQPPVFPDAVGNPQAVEDFPQNGFVGLQRAHDDAVLVKRPAAREDAASYLEDLRPRGRGFHDFDCRGGSWTRRQDLQAGALQGVAGKIVRHRDHELLCLLLQGLEQLFLLPREIVEAGYVDVSDASEPALAEQCGGQRDALIPMHVA